MNKRKPMEKENRFIDKGKGGSNSNETHDLFKGNAGLHLIHKAYNIPIIISKEEKSNKMHAFL